MNITDEIFQIESQLAAGVPGVELTRRLHVKITREALGRRYPLVRDDYWSELHPQLLDVCLGYSERRADEFSFEMLLVIADAWPAQIPHQIDRLPTWGTTDDPELPETGRPMDMHRVLAAFLEAELYDFTEGLSDRRSAAAWRRARYVVSAIHAMTHIGYLPKTAHIYTLLGILEPLIPSNAGLLLQHLRCSRVSMERRSGHSPTQILSYMGRPQTEL